MTTIICLLVAAAAGEGEEAKRRVIPLSVREAVSLSLNHNIAVEVARYGPWIEDQNVHAALGTWDHVAYASASGSDRTSPGFSLLSGATILEQETQGFTVGLRKTLPFGPSFDLSFRSTRFESNNSFLLVNPRHDQSMGATVTIPLLRGASMTANTSTLLVARNTRDIAADTFEINLAASVFQVIDAYWTLVFAIEDKKVREQSLETALRLLEDNRRKFERGVVARIDVTQADAGVAAQREGILTAEAAALNAADRLMRLVDPSLLRQPVGLSPVDAPRWPRGALDEEEAVTRALEAATAHRPEFRQVRRRIQTAGILVERAENNLFPRVDLTGRAFANGTEDSFSSTYGETRTGDFRDLTVGVIFEWPLEGSAARGNRNRAELERRRLRLEEQDLENLILVEVREAVRAIRTNEKRIEATRRARELAREQLDGELSRRDQGLSTTFRVLEVQEDLARARSNELRALIDYTLSLHSLELASGTLLEANSIRLRDHVQPRLASTQRR